VNTVSDPVRGSLYLCARCESYIVLEERPDTMLCPQCHNSSFEDVILLSIFERSPGREKASDRLVPLLEPPQSSVVFHDRERGATLLRFLWQLILVALGLTLIGGMVTACETIRNRISEISHHVTDCVLNDQANCLPDKTPSVK